MPATMTTHAAATYSLGGLTGSGGSGAGGGPTRGGGVGGGGGGAAAAEVGWVEDSGVSLMP
ncbi:Mycobacterium numidiamassiliense ORFan [Mycobacterium numidiamassiliense]|uniref:Mycobacterium numidiamassiliense ORFan n=1 Tax=Mycobacterium numidiamassiliense TaxID=1841861 RepID=A0A2U3P853_9MYCO|nr:Mycobacterium numidiamassiliense ORFan [Mycobacterium numidiamassiliense]